MSCGCAYLCLYVVVYVCAHVCIYFVSKRWVTIPPHSLIALSLLTTCVNVPWFRLYIHTYIHVYIYIYIYVYTTSTRTSKHKCVYIYIYACMYARMYVCACVCMYGLLLWWVAGGVILFLTWRCIFSSPRRSPRLKTLTPRGSPRTFHVAWCLASASFWFS